MGSDSYTLRSGRPCRTTSRQRMVTMPNSAGEARNRKSQRETQTQLYTHKPPNLKGTGLAYVASSSLPVPRPQVSTEFPGLNANASLSPV